MRKNKTPMMLLIEAKDSQKRPIEKIMLDAFAKYGNQRDAAREIGINHALFNQWAFRFGLTLTKSRQIASESKPSKHSGRHHAI